jgi:putative ABC transport system substrate-binding protein
MTAVVDPLATGFVASLARPGGNITGLSMMTSDLVGKQMQLLKELVPKISRMALLWNPANPSNAPYSVKTRLPTPASRGDQGVFR